MGRRATSVWLIGLLGLGLLTGCKSSMGRHGWSDDPLVQSKKPVNCPGDAVAPVFVSTIKPETAPPAPLAALGIDTPSALAATGTTPAPVGNVPDSTPFRLIDSHRGPLPALPVARTRAGQEQAAEPPIQRQVRGTYGHARDYAWLQGVLDRDYRGQIELRYCPPAIEDRWGGKVYLDDDPRLQSFRDGDRVVVRGALQTQVPPLEEGWHYPHYQIDAILLLHRGE